MFDMCTNERIKIEYEKGSMVINLDAFFPTSQKKVMKLMKVIALDYKNRDDIVDKLKEWLLKVIDEMESTQELSKEESNNVMKKVIEVQSQVMTKTTLDGLPLSKEGLKNARKELTAYKQELKVCNDTVKGFEKSCQRLKRNYELIHKGGMKYD